MWRPSFNFVNLHYLYIIFIGLLGLVILYPYGNISAIDAYFFGVSASTESGLNPVDVKELKTYQQVFLYFAPIVTNLGFINLIVVAVRLFWFKKHLKQAAPSLLRSLRRTENVTQDPEVGAKSPWNLSTERSQTLPNPMTTTTTTTTTAVSTISPTDQEERTSRRSHESTGSEDAESRRGNGRDTDDVDEKDIGVELGPRITFDSSADHHPRRETALYIPGPRDREQGEPLVELKEGRLSQDDLSIHTIAGPSTQGVRRRRRRPDDPRLNETRSLGRVATVASSIFIIGTESRQRRPSLTRQPTSAAGDFPQLSHSVTIGRNSQFLNLSERDREELGGIEYRSLKLLLKICLSYFFGLHIFGAICLVGWIQHAHPKYRQYLEECGQDKNWWAFYSAQTMVDNLGLTLTPDSMIQFRDATFPMLLMSFLAFAGHTCYPVFLRLVIWTGSKLAPRDSSVQEPLSFLLNHPRRCYTLLFPSGPTWVLFGILVVLNFIDTLLIIVLDLDNDAVADLAPGPRLAAAIFQSISSRHTGTTSFNLAEVNPAVQLSLLVMMYISIFPIAMVIRTSNTYEERALGIYRSDEVSVDEEKGGKYLMAHLQNQLSFDMWYIFLGIFCICIAESSHIMDDRDPAFAVFPIFFEVVSAYANVGLSLGYPTVSTSLSGRFSVFSKVVICAMMIRGRHRGLPYQLDRAIVLPDEQLVEDADHDRRE